MPRGRQKKIKVKNQKKAKRRKRHWVEGHWVKTSKPVRNKTHPRNKRSTNKQMEARAKRNNLKPDKSGKAPKLTRKGEKALKKKK